MMSRLFSSNVLLGIAPIVLIVAVWQGLVSFGFAPAVLLPPPGFVFGRLLQQLVTWTFQQEIAATLIRLFAGFAIAVVLGVSLGIAAGSTTLKRISARLVPAAIADQSSFCSTVEAP